MLNQWLSAVAPPCCHCGQEGSKQQAILQGGQGFSPLLLARSGPLLLHTRILTEQGWELGAKPRRPEPSSCLFRILCPGIEETFQGKRWPQHVTQPGKESELVGESSHRRGQG